MGTYSVAVRPSINPKDLEVGYTPFHQSRNKKVLENTFTCVAAMHPIPVPVSSPLNIAIPQGVSILVCSLAYCFATLDATTIRCCDGLSTEPALVAVAAITVVYHATAMLFDNYLRLWAAIPPPQKTGIQPPTVYSHLAFIIITPFVWVYWAALLPYHAVGYRSQDAVSGQHYFIPMLVLEGLEIGMLGWLWGYSLFERLRAKNLAIK
ncbi:hypothetical protein DL96DRAFT_1558791 [Flagelloscypha sp. PMI_526]|nr:hypothetical protein DL96DRAFT_1558791 [Flagelloscypha sp. PMI_526]